jgi:tetratricopeptide (TPR) repeat protein
MTRIFFSLLLIFFCFGILPGQTYRQYIKAADEEFTNLNYYSAMKHYQEAMSIEGPQPEVMYKYAESARLFASYTYADTAYTKVLASDKAKDYPLAKYWLATVKKKQGKYEESQAFFRQFVAEHPHSYPDYTRSANAEIEALDWAIEAINNADENITVEHLGDEINTPYSEFAPIVWKNDLYYTSLSDTRRLIKGAAPRQYAIVKRAKSSGKKPEKLKFNDPQRHTAHASFNRTNTRLYYALCDFVGESAEIRCEIWYRPVDPDGDFGKPVKLPEDINKPGYTTTDPSISYDEEAGKEWLFFVSDRPGGQGEEDIWMSELKDDGNFSKPVNLADINTAEKDITPFYHPLSKTLYFSSEGRQGFGGFDMYKAVRKNGKWEDIEHLPVPFNSSYNDTHFWLNDNRTKGYFSSSRLGSFVLEPEFEACCNDLFSFVVQIVDLDVFTFNKRDNKPLEGVTLKLFELTKDGSFELASTTNPAGNDFDFELKKGTKYALLATRPGFLPMRDTLDLALPKNTTQRNIERKLYLVPEKVDLHVASFNKKTSNPLKSVEVRLVIDGQEVDFKKNETGNEVDFVLERGKLYQLIGSKVAYFSDTAFIDLRTDVTTTFIDQKLNLKPKEMEDFPPLVIYFDNDYPDPKTRKTTTETNYKENWEAYMQRKEKFMQEYVKSLVGFDSITAARRMEAFFDREVYNQFLALEVFCESVLDVMDDGGFRVELVIQGFTSPRASEEYNNALSQRRSDCLKNHFETWRGGVLRPYIDKRLITMEVVGFGEKLSPQFISDRLDDERESIYSVVASFERKVAIIGARRVAEN